MKRFFPILLALLVLAGCAAQDDIPPSSPGPDRESSHGDSSYEPAVPPEMTPDVEDAESALDSAGDFAAPEESDTPSELPSSSTDPSSREEPSSGGEEASTEPVDTQPVPQADAPSAGGAHAMWANASTVEQELLQLINAERQLNGLEVLGMEDDMQFAAQIRAEEVLDSLSHTRPDGTPYHTAFDEAGFSYAGKWHGENLAIIKMSNSAYDSGVVAQAIFAEWTGSPGHYQNMLGDQFQQTGIGVYIHTDGGLVSVGAAQLFASL